MSYYEFKEDDAYLFSQKHGPSIRIGNQLVFTYCPYCEGGRHRDKKTFAIDLKTGQYNCKRGSCGAKGNMITLSQNFNDFDLGIDVQRHYNIRDYNSQFRKFSDSHRITESDSKAIEFMKSRGISEEICRRYEITVAKEDKTRIVFPFKDETGELKFIKYRNTDPKKIAERSKEWCEKNCMPILFGMNHCEGFGQLVVTEGQIDSLSLTEAGIENAVSVPTGKNGFTWVPHCWNWITKFQKIVVFGDCENGEITLAEEMRKRFPNKTYVVRAEDYQGFKDANEILLNIGKDALRKAVLNAESAPIQLIKDMADVEQIDIESLPAISSGNKELNEILSGGFHFGDLVILTGRRGDGKSTMASMFVCWALRNDFNSLIYSGEMKDYAVKNWLDRQAVGENRRTLFNSEKEAANAWYRGRLFIYDDTEIDENETGKLLETIETAIIQKGIKFILIDNLMTAMEDSAETNEALYRQQSNFTGRLAKMARKFDVVILLVCHPRKSNGNLRLDNDDISGSADITNKANIVMTYSRSIIDGKESDPAVRIIEVTKNRLTGKTGKVAMAYNENNKQVVGVKVRSMPLHFVDGTGAEEPEEEETPF